jgi:hypothetical protein
MMDAVSRLARSGAVWFALAQLAVLLALWLTAMQPGFRGGGFIQAVLTLLVAIQGAAVLVDCRRALWPDPVSSPTGIFMSHEAEMGVDPRRFLIIASHLSIMLILVYVVGMYVGLFVFLLGYWRLTGGRTTREALALAALFGALLPFLFSRAVRVPLWTGVVPELVPGVIGGSITPPL